jgi:CRP/FNR family transcriptional regulator
MAQFRAAIPAQARSDAIAERLCAIGRYRGLDAGEALPGNAREDRLVFIARGVTKLIAQLPAPLGGEAQAAGKTQVLAFNFPGDIVSVLRESSGDFRIVALRDTQLIVFLADQFIDIAEDDPAVIRAMIASSIQALHASRTRMMQLGHKSARERIAEFLASMAGRLCNCSSGTCELDLPMSRRDIADSLGLTIETVSRQFADLREAGLIETRGRSIVRLRDLDTLLGRGECQKN